MPDAELPRTESLRDTVERTLPYWKCTVFPALVRCDRVLVVAHGNSLRGIVKYLKDISDEAIAGLNLPTGVPWVFSFDERLRPAGDRLLGDAEQIRLRAEEVAAQGTVRG